MDTLSFRERRQLDDDGYLAFEGLVDPGRVRAMRSRPEGLLGETEQAHAGALVVGGLLDEPVPRDGPASGGRPMSHARPPRSRWRGSGRSLALGGPASAMARASPHCPCWSVCCDFARPRLSRALIPIENRSE